MRWNEDARLVHAIELHLLRDELSKAEKLLLEQPDDFKITFFPEGLEGIQVEDPDDVP